ncbi:GYDIA family GHMP kinase [Arenibacter algicola]|mgnify:FL=1|uniref:GHMP kinase n=1 Tax=Arenibacter algicola TaxID=616991 RepID=A0A221USC0_9FLAO|nr:GYDIA family GHMP kinase [Arenibacter algicola]ASO04227.1 GHMP kinase [Arenibacter algicola]|tara:strand:+ start:2004 stop:2927 length:924 start_codon:yes stop_codon:yes gene_type:complete
MTKQYYSNGKLLITGEYLVLDGAQSLAVPTLYGQSLSVKETQDKLLTWKSLDDKGKPWFESDYELEDFDPVTKNTVSEEALAISVTLKKILLEARKLNPSFLSTSQGYEITTALNFPREWGLGSSSTLINNIAQWAQIDAYVLLWNAFSGSGYDIACAQNNSPIIYQLKNSRPIVHSASFNPTFKSDLYFVYLNQKQNSRDGIAQYRNKEFNAFSAISQINSITQRILTCTRLSQFDKLIKKHESILSEILGTPTVKERLFPDFKGAIKSLGAWGGDFILATGNKTTPDYFKEKGYATVIPYSKMVK